jgi:hypothetical protein
MPSDSSPHRGGVRGRKRTVDKRLPPQQFVLNSAFFLALSSSKYRSIARMKQSNSGRQSACQRSEVNRYLNWLRNNERKHACFIKG